MRNPRCDICNKFMSLDDVKIAKVYIPFGSYGDTEPPEEIFMHSECWNKLSQSEKDLTKRISWQKNF